MTYPGGKFASGVWQRIINQLPPHTEYCEPFAGGAAVYLHKRPAALTVLIDKDAAAVQALTSTIAGHGLDAPASRVVLVEGDGISYLENWRGRPGTLAFVDPPYPLALRRQQRRIYRYELSGSDHDRLVEAVLAHEGALVLSGYPGPPYTDALRTWRRIEYRVRTHRGEAVECLWFNYPEPAELHDTRFVGAGYRERERIKRLVTRWGRRFDGLPASVRAVLLERLAGAPRAGRR